MQELHRQNSQPTSISSSFDKLRKSLWLGIGGLVAAGLSIAHSAYEQRQSEFIPVAGINQDIKAGRWLLSLVGAQRVDWLPDGTALPPGQQAIAVELNITNASAESSNSFASLLTMADLPSLQGPTFYLMRDRQELRSLQPRLTEHVTATWLIPKDQPMPSTVTVSVNGETFKAVDSISGLPGWFGAHAVAQIPVTVESGAGTL